ncbi:MAG: isoprenylcysteine carboxylmethyltransferase family protein [Candidatus Dormibacteria bacterium]
MSGLGRFCWLSLLLAAQRARELRASAQRERGVTGRVAAPEWFPAMVAVHVALFVAPALEIGICQRRSRHPRTWLATLALATCLRRWCISALGDSWNVRGMVPEALQVSERGPYRWLRHPNYVAVIVEFAALPLAGGAWISALGLSAANLAVLAPRIRAEEALLMQDPTYRRLFSARARFIPGIF